MYKLVKVMMEIFQGITVTQTVFGGINGLCTPELSVGPFHRLKPNTTH